MFLQHKCQQHRPFTCFNWHFQNQKRRRPILRRDGSFNYSADIYCEKYDETTGLCPIGDECVAFKDLVITFCPKRLDEKLKFSIFALTAPPARPDWTKLTFKPHSQFTVVLYRGFYRVIWDVKFSTSNLFLYLILGRLGMG